MSKATHLRIHGRVQGVWYRGWTVKTATRLGLSGWVRNRSDGTVEALVAGPDDQVEALITECHKGPIAARVDRVDVTPSDETVEQGSFQQLPTL